ncbi:cell division regulator GpsB [Mammaliicoccus vitulinus]|uniref:cell division regulator GpsB n=1 Tax=Mammaliicoccus vitulinus TaxID=71237 RepID=UPI000D1D1574|nr:cell division regulator GpsB [Mammaliicoccus vitulinus]PTI88989.1 cell division regulator GpsB [Mammaliicoccus vitulinus]
MADVTLKLSAKDIDEKEFERGLRGLKTEEVDAFLDDIISDYQKMADLNNEVIKLTEENSKLNKEIEQLRIRVASGRPQGSQQYNSNNVDILKRISNLEKAVFGE